MLKDVDVSFWKVWVGVMFIELKCVNEFIGFDLNIYKCNKKFNWVLEKFKGVDVVVVVKKFW